MQWICIFPKLGCWLVHLRVLNHLKPKKIPIPTSPTIIIDDF
jgi:hypothetical protein